MLPPVGAIVVGPCPECKGLVVVFFGQVLPLDNDIMFKGSMEEQREHLMSVITPFIQERVEELVSDEAQTQDGPSSQEPDDNRAEPVSRGEETAGGKKAVVGHRAISNDDIETFLNMELKLLDNGDYFKAIFGQQRPS